MTDRPFSTDPTLMHYIASVHDLLLHHWGPLPAPVDWNCHAYLWKPSVHSNGQGNIVGLPQYASIQPEDLLHIETQKKRLFTNTEQFINRLPANHALLTGARGTGKSSLVRSLLANYATQGLRMLEVGREQLINLPQIMEQLASRPEYFIIFCDDLSFSEAENQYRALKVVLDGTLHATARNTLIYATSNRRHLLPKKMQDNLETHYEGDEIHPGESIDEKISLSDRFGLWLSFHAQNQDEYLDCAAHWLKRYGGHWDTHTRQEALRFAAQRSHRSGRSAWHFAQDFAGKTALHPHAAPHLPSAF